VKIFLCPACQHVVYFESVRCMNCGTQLGFSPDRRTMAALTPASDRAEDPPTRETLFHAQHDPGEAAHDQARLCANYVEHHTCNWIVPADDVKSFCRSCRLNAVIPPLAAPGALTAWARLEAAKRRLIYTLLSLQLPLAARSDDPPGGLAFAFKQDVPGGERVTTGHAGGIITINLAEADDAHREKTRTRLGEKYRSLLGHFRHESGHYYWERLIDGSSWMDEFRTVFGDERADYATAIAQHYQQGPPANWLESYVSPYAAAHPWEDWAESWAHYLHMVDTLETSRCYGITLRPQPVGGPPAEKLALRSVSLQEFDTMINAWVPLTLALNDFNRGMGLPDLYPFALATPAIEKIGFVHRVIHDRSDNAAANQASVARISA
jgi:hypothetical protein